MQNSPLKIHPVGLDDRSRNILGFFFQKYCHGKCEMVSEKHAEVFLINMDNHNSEQDYERLIKQNPFMPMILMALKPIDTGKHYFLRKPMIANHLLEIIDNITNKRSNRLSSIKSALSRNVKPASKVIQTGEIKLSEPMAVDVAKPVAKNNVTTRENKQTSQSSGHAAQLLSNKEELAFVGDAKDIDLQDKQAASSIYFDPEHYLLGFILQAYRLAKKEQCVVRLTGLWRSITFFADVDAVYVELTDRQLQSLCVIDLEAQSDVVKKSAIKIEKLTREEAMPECTRALSFQALDSFVWKVALWTSRGRIPYGIEFDQPVYIESWPNLSRLIVTPHALRIIAFWIMTPRPLTSIIESLSISQRYVFSLFTATYCIGIANQARRASDILVSLPSEITSTKKVGLFTRIMNKLR